MNYIFKRSCAIRVEIIIDDGAIIKKDCGCKAKKVIDLIDNLNEEEFEKIETHMIKKEESRAYLLETKEAYVEIIADLLGLRADATVERITPAVMKKINELITKIKVCVKQIQIAYKAFFDLEGLLLAIKDYSELNKNLALELVLGQIKSKVKEIIELEIEKVIQVACYVTIKRTYAQEVQYLFFWGEDSINKKYIEIK